MGNEEREEFENITSGMGDISPEAQAANEDIALRERMSQMVDRLEEEKLGRALVVNKPKSRHQDLTQSDVSRLADAIEASRENSEVDTETVGYALPITPDNTSHLIVFKDGDMRAIEPARKDTQHNVDAYTRAFSPNESPFRGPSKGVSNVADLKSYLVANSMSWRITHENTGTENLPQMYDLMDQAIATAVETKKDRDVARRESSHRFLDKLDETVFKKPEAPRNNEPPPPSSQS